jgi:hypothetical protein
MTPKKSRSKTTENCPICGRALKKERAGSTVYYGCEDGLKAEPKHHVNAWKRLKPGEKA